MTSGIITEAGPLRDCLSFPLRYLREGTTMFTKSTILEYCWLLRGSDYTGPRRFVDLFLAPMVTKPALTTGQHSEVGCQTTTSILSSWMACNIDFLVPLYAKRSRKGTVWRDEKILIA